MSNSLKNKKILITGITGFVGSHLTRALKAIGADVYGIAKSGKSKRILKGSILDYSIIDAFIKDHKITICFHLAGESLVESGQKDPYNVFRINTEGTLNVLEIARKRNLERIIIASTSHVYGRNRVPYFEGYIPRPSRPYETSKACTDLIAQSYALSFSLPVLIPRFVNIYGPGDLNFTRLVPKTIRSVLLAKSPKMWGGDAIRDYLYIDDAIDAYIRLGSIDLSKIDNNRIFNFGGGNKISVEELIKKIILFSKKDISIKKIPQQRPEEIVAQYVSFNKSAKVLDWKPTVSLDDGLKKTFDWYKVHKDLL